MSPRVHLLRIALEVSAAQVELAVAAWELAGVFNSSVEYDVAESSEEPWPGHDNRTDQAEVVAYISRSQWTAIETRLRESAATLLQRPASIDAREMPNRDWRTAWHEHFDLVRVPASARARATSRPVPTVIIRPPHIAYHAKPDEVVIDLAPGLAFGTGQHQSTRLCLQLLAELVVGGERVLDVGSGSGVLAVAAAKLGAASVLATDIDPIAVDAARETVRRNQVSDRVRVQHGSVPDARADLISANLTADILQYLAPDLSRALRPGGQLIASGLIVSRREAVAARFADHGLSLVAERQEDEWLALVCQRPAASSRP